MSSLQSGILKFLCSSVSFRLVQVGQFKGKGLLDWITALWVHNQAEPEPFFYTHPTANIHRYIAIAPISIYNTTSVPYDLGARPLAFRKTLRDSSVDLYGDPVICHLGPCSLRLVDIHPGAVRLHCHIQAWVNCWRWLIAGPFFNFVGKFPKTLYVSRESWEGWEKKGVIVIFLLLVWMEGIWK